MIPKQLYFDCELNGKLIYWEYTDDVETENFYFFEKCANGFLFAKTRDDMCVHLERYFLEPEWEPMIVEAPDGSTLLQTMFVNWLEYKGIEQ